MKSVLGSLVSLTVHVFLLNCVLQVEKHNRTVVGGNNGRVGPGGFIAGGGFGPLNPSLGLGVDNVLEIKVILHLC